MGQVPEVLMNGRSALLRIRHLWSVHRGSRLGRNMSAVALGQLIAQTIALVSTPILTRLFLPEDFALLAVFVGAVALATCVSTWRFEWAVPIARSASLAAACIALGLITTFLVPSIGASVLLLGAALPGEFSRLIDHTGTTALLGLAIFLVGADALLQGWLTRSGDIQILGVARVLQTLTTTALSILLWYETRDGHALVWGIVGGYLASILVVLSRTGGLWVHLSHLRISSLRRGLRRFGNMTSLSVASSINQTAVLHLLPVLLLMFHTPTEVGWFALVQRIAIGPVGFISAAVTQGFWSEASQLIHKDPARLRDLYLKITRLLALLALPLMVICALGPLFVGPLLGRQDWDGAGWVLTAIVPMIFGMVAVSPLNHLVAHDRAGWVLGWDFGRAIAIGAVTVLVASTQESFVLTILALSIVHLVSYLALVALHLRSFSSILRRRSYLDEGKS